MYVRLAFAVAAHLEPEILIVDEVLAVGDAEFQKKCLGKMKDVSQNDGRTVLFVSHNMGAIAQLCNKTIVLNQGTVSYVGKTEEAIIKYFVPSEKIINYTHNETSPSKVIFFESISCLNKFLNESDVFIQGEDIYLKCKIIINSNQPHTFVSFTLQDRYGYYISTIAEKLTDLPGNDSTKQFILKVPTEIISPNLYFFRFAIFKYNGEVYDLLENICGIKIADIGSKMALFEGYNYGSTMLHFEINPI
jgi:lipopolysaccharide transport system ATP-binding protein